jgi:hypothetical protein
MDFSVLFPRGNRVIIDVPESLQLRGARIMKRLVPVFALSLFLTFHLPTHAQTNQASDDASAVRATVTDYIEAYYTGEAKRMERALHPHYLKHMIHGDIPVRERTGLQMVQDVRANYAANLPPADRTEQVTVLDVANHRLRETGYSGLGRLHDALEIRRPVEDSLGRPEDRQIKRSFPFTICGAGHKSVEASYFFVLRRNFSRHCEFQNGILLIMGIPPPPSVYWHHGVSGKSQSNLWSSITCGQNLDFKELASAKLGSIPETVPAPRLHTVTASTMIS